MHWRLTIFIVIIASAKVTGQPGERFYGGSFDGFDQDVINTDSSIYTGTYSDGFSTDGLAPGGTIYFSQVGDGFDAGQFAGPGSINTGNTGDGFSLDVFMDNNSIYFASSGDGFDVVLIFPAGSINTGSSSDGFSSGMSESSGTISRGGSGDGFDLDFSPYYHRWLGTTSNKWIDTSNWVNFEVPDENLRVLIPAGATFYPINTPGTLTVGNASGNYICKELMIEQGAQVRNLPGVFTLITSKLEISGLMIIEDTSPNAFRVNGGKVMINTGGELKIEQ